MYNVALIGGKDIEKYTIAPTLWKIISDTTKVPINHITISLETSSDVKKWIQEIKKGDHIVGFNIALPWKEEILKYVENKDDFTNNVGIANTVVNKSGQLFSYNTDNYGATIPYEQKFGSLDHENILILGAGGAGKSLAYYLNSISNLNVSIFDIDKNKLFFKNTILPIHKLYSFDDVKASIKNADYIINATTVGKYFINKEPEYFASPISFETIKNAKANSVFMDMNYYPPKTLFLELAEQIGHPVIEGTKMLAFQAMKTFEIIFNTQIDDTKKEQIINKLEKFTHDRLRYY